MDITSKISSIIYAILLIIGGIIGYVKAHSEISLLVGLLSGVSILLACISDSTRTRLAYLFLISMSLLIALSFSLRFAVNQNFMPTGLMLTLSTANYVLVGRGWLKYRAAQTK